MSPSRKRNHAAHLLLATLVTALLGPVEVISAMEPSEAIEEARALERDGHIREAESYLRGLVSTDDDLARNAEVLLELARLTPSAEESLNLVQRALSRTRDGVLVSRATELRGDYLYALGRYVEAGAAYEEASTHASREVSDWILLKRAASLLALGDASAAVEAYGDLAGEGSVPSEVTPWAVVGLGQALLAAGDAERAAAEFDRVAGGYPRHDARPRALFGAAQAHNLAGNVEAARGALNEILAGYPGTFEAVLARDDLRALRTETDRTEPDSTAVLRQQEDLSEGASEELE